MINETLIVKQYLDGKNINKRIIYRICFLLSKWYKENGVENKADIRKLILQWAKQNSIHIEININDCIDRAVENKRRLTTDNEIRISTSDVEEIKSRFDNKNVRLIALGILCYAKQFADINNEFDLHVYAFSDWLGIDPSNLINRYINEIVDYGYITKTASSTSSWRGVAKSKSPKYKINVPVSNVGEAIIQKNDIRKLYQELF